MYQSSTRARNNTNTRYSPLEAVGINPRLERETMDNTRTSLEWFTTRRLLAEWAFNASIECLILEDRAVECSASATLPLSGTVLFLIKVSDSYIRLLGIPWKDPVYRNKPLRLNKTYVMGRSHVNPLLIHFISSVHPILLYHWDGIDNTGWSHVKYCKPTDYRFSHPIVPYCDEIINTAQYEIILYNNPANQNKLFWN